MKILQSLVGVIGVVVVVLCWESWRDDTLFPMATALFVQSLQQQHKQNRRSRSDGYYAEPTTSSSFYETLSSSSSSSSPDHCSIAQTLGVKPGWMDFSPQFWKFAWKTHGRLLPLLHGLDKARTSDLDSCLKVLWCKALVGLDRSSPAYDGGLAYDMLPSGSRNLVRLPESLFPRLVHFVIELRTVFLDRALQEEIRHYQNDDQFNNMNNINKAAQKQMENEKDNNINNKNKSCRIRLVTLGAGYDTRSVKFLNSPYDGCCCQIDEAWELDIQQVVDSKSIMLQRLQSRRPVDRIPCLVAQDLTDANGLQSCLHRILKGDDDDDKNKNPWHTIFLVEGVLIYLNEDDKSQVLSLCAQGLRQESQTGSVLFADRIRKLRDPDISQMKTWLQSNGWDLVEQSFCVHPGKTRHMGAARVT